MKSPPKICPCIGCDAKIPRHMLSCRRHWFMAPKALRDAIWVTVNNDWRAWAKNAQEFVRFIAAKEGRECTATEFDRMAAPQEPAAE
jgi:hypothetical protein